SVPNLPTQPEPPRVLSTPLTKLRSTRERVTNQLAAARRALAAANEGEVPSARDLVKELERQLAELDKLIAAAERSEAAIGRSYSEEEALWRAWATCSLD